MSSVLAGTLPLGWAKYQAFPALSNLTLWSMQLSGSLPAEWGSNGSWPSHTQLKLGWLDLTGVLPAEWGSPSAFQMLSDLDIAHCSIKVQRIMIHS